MKRKIVLYILLWSLSQFALVVLLRCLFAHPVLIIISAAFAFLTALGLWLLLEGVEEVNEDVYREIEEIYDAKED